MMLFTICHDVMMLDGKEPVRQDSEGQGSKGWVEEKVEKSWGGEEAVCDLLG